MRAAAKFEEKLDDILRERDYRLRELLNSSMTPLRSGSPPRNLPWEPTNASPVRGPGTLLSSQPPPEPPRMFQEPIPRWSPDRSAVDSAVGVDEEDTLHTTTIPPTISRQPITVTTTTPTSTQIPPRSRQNPVAVRAPQTPLSTPRSVQRIERPVDAQSIPISQEKRHVMRTEDEKMHDVAFLSFLHGRGVIWSRMPALYAQRFKVYRSKGSLEVRYYGTPKENRIPSGACVALSLHERPRLKSLVDKLWRK